VARLVLQEGATLPTVGTEDKTAVLELLTPERDAALTEATRPRNQLHHLLLHLDPEDEAHPPALRTAAGLAALEGDAAPGPRPARPGARRRGAAPGAAAAAGRRAGRGAGRPDPGPRPGPLRGAHPVARGGPAHRRRLGRAPRPRPAVRHRRPARRLCGRGAPGGLVRRAGAPPAQPRRAPGPPTPARPA